ncbi:MAG: enamine deaminase RidA (YjgF/YER057c/UK114 family) [Gammaproteobacteria bacterium]|jgi:enamine deaminase RidA (YjgF/YER057c/UK114 family)
MERKDIVPQGMEIIRERFNYSPGVLVGDTLYIAGQVGRDENLNVVDGADAQYIQAFENVNKVLSAAGATFDNVVDMVTYHIDVNDLANFMKIKDRYFTNKVPAWTGIGVTALAMPGLLIEIKCVAKL